MAFDLSETLVVGISATALFDLEEADQLFREKLEESPETAIKEYRKYMLKREEKTLDPGTGLPLVKALLRLNKHQGDGKPPLTEVVIMSRNSPETGVRVLNTIRELDLDISRSAFTAGEDVTDYLEAFDIDLFLTTDFKDAQYVIDSQVCAAALLEKPPTNSSELSDEQVRIAFDGDAVIFSEESEIIYQKEGLEAFHKAEDEAKDIPLEEGPYADLLKKLSKLQNRLPMRVEYSPVRIALVTSRNSPAEMRVIKTLREWGVYVDEAFFLGGLPKHEILEAFKPHIFFDDQKVHLENTAKSIHAGLVPYQTNSELSIDENTKIEITRMD